MDSGTPQQTGSKHESTSSTNKANVRLDEDNALAVQHVTEIIEKIDLKPAESETRKQLLNKRAISKIASTYELETFKENLLIIFYHENIKGFKPRIGTERHMLMETFKKFGFVFKEHKDCKMDEIFCKLEEYTHPSKDLSKYGCVAVAVITYGTDDRQLRAKDMPYCETEIYKRLVLNENKTLITKPKVIIIEAFPGEELNPKDEVDCPEIIVRDSDEMDYRIPRESDSLILYSHYACSPSRRTNSFKLRLEPWFIRVLCEKINRHASELDLVSIMTDVLNQVNDSNLNLPVVTSTMLRKLFLRNFGDGPPLMQSFTDDKSRNELSHNLITIEPISSFENMYCDFAKTCLKYYIEEKPNDETAKGLLEEANTSEDIVKISKSILDHLMVNAQDCQCFKQMHVLNN